MRTLLFSLSVILCTVPYLLTAQFPLMDLNGNVVNFHPTTLRVAVGADQIQDPGARFKVANGKIQIENNALTAQMLEFFSTTGGYARFNQTEDGDGIRTDWSLQPADNTTGAWISMFRHTETDTGKGLRFYRGNGLDELDAQVGLSGVNSFFQLYGGNLGVGHDAPKEKVHVLGNAIRLSTPGEVDRFIELRTDGDGLGLQSRNGALFVRAPQLFFGNDGAPAMAIDPQSQKVCIAIEPFNVSNDFRFAVNGKGIMEELLIKNSDSWPDYVFSPEYKRRSLADLHRFVTEKGHLPGVPSAAEVKEKGGMEVGTMQKILLEKIEELTLYLIDLKNENEALKERISRLEK